MVNSHIPIEIAAIILLLLLANINSDGDYSTITRLQGVILLLFAVGYIIYTIYEENKSKDKNAKITNEKDNTPMFINVIYIILGILGLKYGSDFVVDNAVIIAENIGLSEQFIGVTIIAIGTTLPEIITGIVAARKDASDLLLGNIIGSNILNLCLLAGIGSIISPLIYQTSFNSSILLLLAITVLLQFKVVKSDDNKLTRKTGAVMLLVYVCYIIFMMK